MKIFGRNQAKKLLPRRKKTSNKSYGGRSLIIAGHSGLFGAAIFSATAAARSGSGYTQLLTDLKKYSLGRHPDFLTADIHKKSLRDLNFNAVGVGPGLGVGAKTLKILRELKRLKIKNVVVDADALTTLAKQKNFTLPSSWIITPHEGELARLLNVSSKKIAQNRLEFLTAAQKKFSCIVLLKGHHTLISDGKNIYQIQSGNSALAKSGTGDVLTGIITGFLAQGLSGIDAATLGAYVHGFMADRWIRSGKDELSLLASDLLEDLPLALKALRS